MKSRRWIANVFLVTGILAIIISVGSIAVAVAWQDWENWVFDRDSRGEPATITGYAADQKDRIIRSVRAWCGLQPAAKPSGGNPAIVPRSRIVKKSGILGRLTIQRLDLSAIVREGDEAETLSLALGHIPGTALPGQAGNIGIAGHRDTLFRGLRKVRKDDLIRLETHSGTYLYKVASIEIVKPQDVGVLNPGPYPELTLVTCYPFYYIGSAPDRFIVKARQEPAANETPAGPNQETAASSGREPGESNSGTHKISFNVSVDHSRQLAPGISFGVTETYAEDHCADGWMWLMPDRRTIWLRNQKVNDPVVFYGYVDGKKREVLITSVTKTSVTGYLILPHE